MNPVSRRAVNPAPGAAQDCGSRVSTAAVGVAFGFLLTSSGFGNYATIHQALLLRSGYVYAVFASAAAVSAAGLALLRRAGATAFGGPLRLPHHPARRRHVYGAAVFGAGFGISGACPASAVAMAATGGMGGLLVLTGMVGGLWLRGLTEPETGRGPARPPGLPGRDSGRPTACPAAGDAPGHAALDGATQEARHATN